MNCLRFRFGLLVLVWPGLLLACDWDRSVDPKQGLDQTSLAAGARRLGSIPGVSDPEVCRAMCCDEPDCDLALLGFPADGNPQCLLVKCQSGGRDVCVLEPSNQFQVCGRRSAARREAPEGGEKLNIVPLLNSSDQKSNDTNNIRCRLPMKVGQCRAAFQKFYYNVTSQSCQSFTYGGCEANGNNFQTREECEVACSGVTGSVLPEESAAAPQLPGKALRMAPSLSKSPLESEPAASESIPVVKEMPDAEFSERCEVEPEVGPCRAAFQRWYYDSKMGGCQSFIYGGCQGNRNNYNSEESCMSTCTAVTVLKSFKRDDQTSPDDREECVSAPDPGPCRAAFRMFYYNVNTAACQPFIYGGCHGNQNRHGSMEECMARCSGYGSFEGFGRARSRWTAASFLLLTLAAISALLVAALIAIMLRRHRLPRHVPSVSDKEELLPDPDESQESLSVPESPKVDRA